MPRPDDDIGDEIAKGRHALTNGHNQDLADAILGILKKRPDSWWSSILCADLVPNANAATLNTTLPTFLRAISLVARDAKDHALDFDKPLRTISAIVDIGMRLSQIRDRLDACDFLNDSKSTQIFRLGWWLQSQHRYGMKELSKVATRDGYLDLTKVHQTQFKGRWAPQGIALDANFESMCGAMDLILRFTLHKGNALDTIDFAKTPYEDKSFEEIGILAIMWLNLNEIWGHIKFNNWTCEVREDAIIYGPNTSAEAIFDFVTQVRQNRFKNSEVLGAINSFSDEFSDDEWTIRRAARKIVIPQVGETWDCCLHERFIIQALESTETQAIIDWFAEHRYYKELIDEAEAGMGNDKVTWTEWLKIREAIIVIARAYNLAHFNRVINDGVVRSEEEISQREIAIVQRTRLVNVLSAVTQVSPERVDKILSLHVFDPNRKQLDIWDHPLLPIGDDLLLIVPVLISTGDILLNSENLTRHFALDGFSERGHGFETSLATKLNALGVKSKASIDAILATGEQKEYDVIAYWHGQIFLIETKCVRSIFDASAEFNARKHLEEAVEQLRVRRDSLKLFWPAIRAAAPELDLPVDTPEFTKVTCIAVLNQMRFTPGKIDGIYITDDLCLLRYFGDGIVNAYIEGKGGRSTLRRQSMRAGAPNLLGFFDYLQDPPQVRAIRNDLTLTFQPLYALRKGDRPLLMPSYSYVGSSLSAISHMAPPKA